MSYCRWSTDDFGCDLYVYESAEGYVIHVAGSRIVGEVPKMVWGGTAEEQYKSYIEQMAYLRTAEREAINLPHDGACFVYDDLNEVIVRLRALQEMGYRFPAHVLTTLQTELDEESADAGAA